CAAPLCAWCASRISSACAAGCSCSPRISSSAARTCRSSRRSWRRRARARAGRWRSPSSSRTCSRRWRSRRRSERWPATAEEEAATPRYLAPQALDDPPTAVDLEQKELARLVGGLVGYVHALRSPEAARAARVAAVTTAFHALAARIAEFDAALAGRDLDAATLRRLALCERQLALTGYLEEALAEVVGGLAEA